MEPLSLMLLALVAVGAFVTASTFVGSRGTESPRIGTVTTAAAVVTAASGVAYAATWAEAGWPGRLSGIAALLAGLALGGIAGRRAGGRG